MIVLVKKFNSVNGTCLVGCYGVSDTKCYVEAPCATGRSLYCTSPGWSW